VLGKFTGCWIATGIALVIFYVFFTIVAGTRENQWPVVSYLQALWLQWMMLAIVIALALLGSNRFPRRAVIKFHDLFCRCDWDIIARGVISIRLLCASLNQCGVLFTRYIFCCRIWSGMTFASLCSLNKAWCHGQLARWRRFTPPFMQPCCCWPHGLCSDGRPLNL